MYIKHLEILGIGGIESLTLDFNKQMNIFCGPNGIGKTTILETIGHIFFAGSTNILKRNVKAKSSSIKVLIDNNGEENSTEIIFDTFVPEVSTQINGGLHNLSSGVISLKTARIFQYEPLQSVNKDSSKKNNILWNDVSNGINLSEIKNWFVNRYLYSAHEGALRPEQLKNYELAKTCFSLLNEDFSFSKVDASSNEIMVNTPAGEIYYEYLSSGFKSIISILFGIIKEIEFRFVDPRINAEDFQGIILIDEIELHLHPEWQQKVVAVLLKAFPKAQFFTTTHSPHVIQVAEPKEIIALGIDGERVIQRELPDSKYGFQGWTIEEVLIDVMGMSDIRTDTFESLIQNFQKAIDQENHEKASKIFDELDNTLHPENTLKKLLRFQLASVK